MANDADVLRISLGIDDQLYRGRALKIRLPRILGELRID
jgi:hypothetical protein